MLRCRAAREGLDDDHAATAVRAGMGIVVVVSMGIAGLILRSHIEQCSRPRNIIGASGFGEQAVMADAVEAVGENVHQEAANELVGCERHHLVAGRSFGAIVFVLKADAASAAISRRLEMATQWV